MDYNNSSRRFRPWGSRVMALSIKCDSLQWPYELRHVKNEFSLVGSINCMSVWEWLEWERKCSEIVVGLDLMLVLSTARLCSLNLSFRRRSQVAQFCGQNCSTCPYITNGLTSYTFYATGETCSITSHITCNTINLIYMVQCNRCNLQYKWN